jgi:5-amino-6-(5-phosphoribosylamino)uracil reductase
LTRPFVFLNVASSIDGKITTSRREAFSLGSEEDRALMEELRARADAVLIGRGTLVDEDPSLEITRPEVIAGRRARGAPEQPLGVLASASLDLSVAGSRFFASPTPRIVFTTPGADADRRRELESRARVVEVEGAAGGGLDVSAMLAAMPSLGIGRLLLEGGGRLNFSLLEADLVDEIHLTLCPMVIGGAQAPSSFEGPGFLRDAIRRLELRSLRVNALGEIFAHYAVIGRGPATDTASSL